MMDAPFDRAAVLENLGGDEELFRQIADIFVASWAESQTRLRTALAKGDAEALRRGAHAIKGSVSNFLAEQAVQAVRDLEFAAKERRLERASELLDVAVAAVEEVVTALDAEQRR